jgi:hypothetical protein
MENRRRKYTTAALAVIVPVALVLRASASGETLGLADVATYLVAGLIPVAIFWGVTRQK